MLWGLAGLVLIAFVHSIMIEFPDLSDFRGGMASRSAHGKFGVDFSTKWTFYLLEW